MHSDGNRGRCRYRRCPACGKALVPEKMGDVTVDRCGACGGIWFDRGEVARVLDLHTEGASGATVEELEKRFPRARRLGPLGSMLLG